MFPNPEEALTILVEKFAGIEEEFVKLKDEFMILWGYSQYCYLKVRKYCGRICQTVCGLHESDCTVKAMKAIDYGKLSLLIIGRPALWRGLVFFSIMDTIQITLLLFQTYITLTVILEVKQCKSGALMALSLKGGFFLWYASFDKFEKINFIKNCFGKQCGHEYSVYACKNSITLPDWIQ